MKAQILAGGRGKGVFDHGFKGGVHLCNTYTPVCFGFGLLWPPVLIVAPRFFYGARPEEAAELTKQMLGHKLVTKQTGPDGTLVSKVMIVQSIDLKRETYFAILMDRAFSGPVMVASPKGGMDIEQVAEESPDLIFKVLFHKIFSILRCSLLTATAGGYRYQQGHPARANSPIGSRHGL